MSGLSRQGKGGFFAKTMEPVPVRLKVRPRLGKGDAETLYSMIFAATVPNLAFDLPFFRGLDPNLRRAELVALTRRDPPLVMEGLRLVLRRGLSRHGVVQTLFEQAIL